MATDNKYTDDPHISSISGTERSPIAQSGVDLYITPDDYKTYILNGYTGSGSIVSTGIVVSGAWASAIHPRSRIVGSQSNPTPNANTDDFFTVTGLATAATFGNPTGAAVDGQKLTIRVHDNGTARVLSFGTAYNFSTSLPNPGTTTAGKTIVFTFYYNFTSSKWDCYQILDNL